MRRWVLGLIFGAIASHATVLANQGGERIQVQDLTLAIPEGWQLKQNALDQNTMIMAFSNASDRITMFVKPGTSFDMQATFVNGSKLEQQEQEEQYGAHTWRTLVTSKRFGQGTNHVKAFAMIMGGNVYYGYSRSSSSANARAHANAFLGALQ